MNVRPSGLLLALLLTGLLARTAAAAAMRHIEFVRPRIGQRGTTVDVSIKGVSLDNPREIVFYEPGVRAIDIQAPVEIPKQRLLHAAWVDQELRCRFVISPDCRPGEHVFRLLTATELTVLGTFHVSPFVVVDEGESDGQSLNDTLETARRIDGDVTVRGSVGSGDRADRDLYWVDVKAGDRLSVEVDSARIADNHYGDSEFDLALRILDRDGRAITANDDNSLHLQDPLASIRLPSDGPVYVEVTRPVYASKETEYCVHIGDYRRPLAAFPAGGPSGTRQSIRLIGDPLGDYEVTIPIPGKDDSPEAGPASAGEHPLASRLRNSGRTFEHFGDAPSALKLRSSPHPNVLEDTIAAVTEVATIPVALNGIIDTPTDRDIYRFTAKRNESLHVRLFAASLGSPIDAAIRIRPLGEDGQPGAVELERDDSRVTAHDIFGTRIGSGGGLPEAIDPSVIWTPRVDGDYHLEVRDVSGAGGPTGVYRVEIEPPRTIVQTVLASGTNDWTEAMRVSGLVIPRGNRWTVDLSLPNGQWNPLKTDFQLVAHGLPEGVRLVSPVVKAGASSWPLQFEADPDAVLRASVITLEAVPSGQQPRIIVETRCQQNVPFINHAGGDAWRTVRTDRYMLGVTDQAPFAAHIEQPRVVLVRGGRLALPVKITRLDGFTGPIEVRCGSVPGSISTPPPLVIPESETLGLVELGASVNAPLATVPFYVIANTMRDDISPYLGVGYLRVSSKIIELTVAQPYVELVSNPESIRRGERKPIVWKIRHHTPFEGEAGVELLGLPKGVSVTEPLPTINKDTTTVTFHLEATGEALLGQVRGLTCEVRVQVEGHRIVQTTGRGTLRIDPAVSE